jgi:hypothetical protein
MDLGSEHNQSIALGKAWLAICLEKHSSCAKKARHANIFCTDNVHHITDFRGDGLVPSRLLAFPITAPQERNADIVKLVLSTELDENTKYVALSHRWGQSRPVPCTMKSSIEYHKQDGLPYNDFPKTFRDAIDVTRGLGFGFLWIDCLCIIQDSPEDWKSEARRMAIIYDNAVLTIAAMDAEDSTQGLTPTNGGCVGILETRGWACQERMIAPRTMMFTRGKVVWECRQATVDTESSTSGEQDSGTVTGCEKHDWMPPTHPKAIFAFLRDWRPPAKDELVTEYHGDLGRSQLELWSNETPLEEINSILSGNSSHKSRAATRPDEPAPADDSTEDLHPDYTWSDDDPPVKIWNVPPPAGSGEGGIYVDHEAGIIYTYYGNELRGHVEHISTEVDFPVFDETWTSHPDGPTSDGEDPFGRFMVQVQHLKLPEYAYHPFMRVWWNFLALYTPRNLTYDKDAFLAMNGISSIAQRWTHIRNSFGLWFSFPAYELCWYVDAGTPAVRPRTPRWIAPSWSWASTRGGSVRNAAWAACARPGSGDLMIKPEIGCAKGTAFNMPLPFQAWRHSKHHELLLKGNLRAAIIKRVRMGSGKDVFEIHVESEGRCSDHEVHTFYPDCDHEFLVDREVHAQLLFFWHVWPPVDGQSNGTSQCLDIHLVLVELNISYWGCHYGTNTMPLEHYQDDRTMRRLGLMKTEYPGDGMRNLVDTINEEHIWRFVRLV